MADWANDDLLITDAARAALYADHPRVAELLDWPVLRELFQQHEESANIAKRWARAAGRRAVWFTFLALASVALGTLHVGTADSLPERLWTMVMAVGTAGFAIAAFGSGLLLMFHGKRKTNWMVDRLWTETLRRFYYQFVLRHLDLALAVMSQARPLADWQAARDLGLQRLQNEEMPRPADALRDILADEVEIKVWTLTEWQADLVFPTVAPGLDIDELLSVLERKRLQIQKDYTVRKLSGGKLALRGLKYIIRSSFYILVFLVLLFIVLIGVSRAYGALWSPIHEFLDSLIAIAAVASAAIVAIQMWDRGERISAETERLEWYLAGVENIHRRYLLYSSPNDKLRALADLETLAYQEMREFLVSVEQSEFVAG